MSEADDPDCWICGKATNWQRYEVPQGALCLGCGRRRHYHPAPCPVCRVRRPLAFLDDQLVVCAGCAGVASPFACRECGSEEHLYGRHRCARCFLRERLSALLTDPTTGEVNSRLQPVFDTLIESERPQTTIWWLRKKPGVGAVLLGQMARGEVPITHDTFRGLPQDLAHGYLRHLLAAVGVLEPFDPYIERMGPWLDGFLDTVPERHRELLRRFGRWHVMKQMRHSASVGRLSRGTADAARHRVRIASKVLAYFDGLGVTAQTATQANLDHYVHSRGRLCGEHGFIRWLRTTGVNPRIRLPTQPQRPDPAVTVGEDHRWELIDQLLHDPSIKPYTRIAGLFTLLFAQRMADIVAMKTSQISHADGLLHVTFNNTAIAMPPPLDNLIAGHLTERGMSLHASRDTGWLFPGGSPGRHIATENIRKQLVAIGLKPYEGRKATLFQLAADIPAPVLGDLIGISHKNAADWARLAARDWRSYIADRSLSQSPRQT
ncbi:hypothetical protein [Nocardioides pelophilus]|uniref:hypothetical protein n=1 Tax=Nocardioides pelophilus TaxID=2172019 RepID=UPI001C7EC4DC|nr:hypothetical protein [Nocardioides pelophilus]